ncbi:hypothetical protein [Ktedonobacter racemifer]|uniref:Uncharacterized protein n=1 Tax=Ktedonobacter racemifer DSM 44963 TaxID=485913 RepID=D6TCJ3_KTERA|nr:hypothetical protein [Ktedonobacter racemifer]EFH90010.1 hypothetical protein Krac_11606 [Ktedonobacter racemifer DSM 44963]
MKQNRTGIISHLYGKAQPQDASHQCVGTSFSLHPEDTPKLTDETKPAGIDTILLCADPAFHNGVKSGRCEFLALAFAKREIVAQDVENALLWAMYDTLRPALWRYGYVCGWNEAFYQYAMRKLQAQDATPKPARDERGKI